MAEIAAGVLSIISRKLFIVVRESIVQQPGTRRLQLEQVRGLPDEEPLNLHLLAEAFLQLFATAFGLIASVWATVVLLGGFATILDKMDFWFATIIVFIESARILGFNPHPEAKFFNEVPQAFMDVYIKPLQRTDSKGSATGGNRLRETMDFIANAADLAGRLALGALLIVIAPVVAGCTCAALSIYRLASISGQDYAGASKDTSKANVKPALLFFYGLVLTQCFFLLLYVLSWDYRSQITESLRKKCEFKEEEVQLIRKYIDNTLDTCIQAGVAKTIKRSLVCFAQDLLQNEYEDCHITAVHVLHALMEQDAHRARTISQIKSSDKCVRKLFGMLSPKSLVDNKTKAYTAAVAARLAGNMQLSDIPGATRTLSSMLDSHSLKTGTHGDYINLGRQRANQDLGTPESRSTTPESKTLIAHGLIILSAFASDPENCIEIYNTNGLVSKIIALLHNGVYLAQQSRNNSIDIIKESLSVLAKLIRGARESSTGLREQILGSDSSIKQKLARVIGEPESQTASIEIITSLAQDEATRGNFLHMRDFVDELLHLCFGANNREKEKILKNLLNLFLTGDNSDKMALAAGALIALARGSDECMTIMREETDSGQTVIQKLPTMLRPDTHVKYRTAIAQMLAHFCANTREEQRNTLEPLRRAFKSVLQAVVVVGAEAELTDVQVNLGEDSGTGRAAPQNEPLLRTILLSAKNHILTNIRGTENQQNQMEPAERKLLAASLVLALQMITINLLPNNGNPIPVAPKTFVKKLKEILERNKESTPDCLDIIRATTELSFWAMRKNQVIAQHCRQERFGEALKEAAGRLAELEDCMILTGNVPDIANYETLPSLVLRANGLIGRQ